MTRLALLGGSGASLALALFFVSATLAEANIGKSQEKDLRKSDNIDKVNGNINEALIKNYQEVKETLRRIFAKGVEVSEAKEDFKDYLEPNFDFREPAPRFQRGRNYVIEKSSSTSLSKSRRRNVIIRENEARISDADEQVVKEQSRGRNHGTQQHAHTRHTGREETKTYLNEWVVHLTGGREVAATLARDLGYHFLGQVRQPASLFIHALLY